MLYEIFSLGKKPFFGLSPQRVSIDSNVHICMTACIASVIDFFCMALHSAGQSKEAQYNCFIANKYTTLSAMIYPKISEITPQASGNIAIFDARVSVFPKLEVVTRSSMQLPDLSLSMTNKDQAATFLDS